MNLESDEDIKTRLLGELERTRETAAAVEKYLCTLEKQQSLMRHKRDFLDASRLWIIAQLNDLES